MSLEEAILEKVREMSPEQQEELLRFADEVKHRPVAGPSRSWDGRKEMAWLEHNRSAYMGLWVALDGDRLVASRKDGKQVYETARARTSRSRSCRTLFLKMARPQAGSSLSNKLEFAREYHYDSAHRGISVPITLSHADRSVRATAILDTALHPAFSNGSTARISDWQ